MGPGKTFKDEEQLARYLRHYVGTPYYMLGGTWKPNLDNLYLFANIWIQGTKADWGTMANPFSKRLPVENPKMVRGHWWYYRVQSSLFAVGTTLMAYGALTDPEDEEDESWRKYMQKVYQLIPRYDQIGYYCWPVGMINWDGEYVSIWDSKMDYAQMKRVVYIRIPKDETQKMMDGMITNMMHGVHDNKDSFRQWQSMFDYAGDSLPSKSYFFNILIGLGEYIQGKPVRDDFYEKDIIKKMEQEHGYRLKTSAKMMRWMLEKAGLRTPTKAWKAIFGKDKVSDISTMERNLKWIPVAERFLKVSDANLYEWFNQQLGTNAKIGEKYRQMLDDEEKMDEYLSELQKVFRAENRELTYIDWREHIVDVVGPDYIIPSVEEKSKKIQDEGEIERTIKQKRDMFKNIQKAYVKHFGKNKWPQQWSMLKNSGLKGSSNKIQRFNAYGNLMSDDFYDYVKKEVYDNIKMDTDIRTKLTKRENLMQIPDSEFYDVITAAGDSGIINKTDYTALVRWMKSYEASK